MIKLDLTSVPARQSLKSDQIENFNVAKEIGDYIYQNTRNTDEYNFAIKLFNAEGEIELADTEFELFVNATSILPVWLNVAISQVIREAIERTSAESTTAGGATIDELEQRRVKPAENDTNKVEVEAMGEIEAETILEDAPTKKTKRKK